MECSDGNTISEINPCRVEISLSLRTLNRPVLIILTEVIIPYFCYFCNTHFLLF
ncbi:hypothetical protein NPD8_3926 (plasmid) [Clostridium botulinum]|uniref:Uncharacterized protein n=1 Tax=Clostridium botulinum TaxID=1491 RepID=A0A1L7JN51_CLOBO|nr:hypothetical protein NPD8_3926 [Clostridium botulinum]